MSTSTPELLPLRSAKLAGADVDTMIRQTYVGDPEDLKFTLVVLLDKVGILPSTIGKIVGLNAKEVKRLLLKSSSEVDTWACEALWRCSEVLRRHLVADMASRRFSLGYNSWVPDVYPEEYPEEMREELGFPFNAVGDPQID